MHRTTERQHHGIEQLYRSLDSDDTATAVSVIVKARGETCDIDCLYCYEKRKEAPGGARVSAAQIGRLATLFRGRPLAVEIHGGEPLTAGREHIAEILRELAVLPKVVRVTLQTNGVLLDEEWLDLFEELCPTLQIGISLDGDAQGNAWRVGYDGEPVYPRVARALNLLAERGRSVGVIAAVTSAVLGRAEAVLDHLAGFGSVNAVSFVPCFDTAIRRPTAATGRRTSASRLLQQAALASDEGPAWAIHPNEYAEFVLAATAHWISAGHFARIKLEPAVSTIRRLRGLGTGFCHFSDLKCDHVFTLYPDGRLGSCDELPWPQAQLTLLATTNDQREITEAQQGSNLLTQGKALMEKCTTCDYRSTCGGGCVATRWRMNPADDQDAYCDHRMRVIDGVAALLAQHATLPGPGALWTTPADLDRWLGHLYDRWHQASLELPGQNVVPYRSADHAPFRYGAGLYADTRPVQRGVFHYGHEHGFSAAAHLTATGTRVACMSNSDTIAADRVAARLCIELRRSVFDDLEGVLARATEEVSVASIHPSHAIGGSAQPDIAGHASLGSFVCTEVPGTLRLTRTCGTLYLWRRGSGDRLVSSGPLSHSGPGYRLTLHSADGHEAAPDGFSLNLDRAPGLHYKRQ
ncbi:radical SAM protein [Kitasatospora sp. NPDC048239]|uniref:radical SAM protein n=1 Tax=Kitasatospora sp. NPDC048239 TaxID=3364046 RepID=UPI0037109FFE